MRLSYTERHYDILMRSWDDEVYKLALKDELLTLPNLCMPPFPAIKYVNVFTDRRLIQRGHGHRTYENPRPKIAQAQAVRLFMA